MRVHRALVLMIRSEGCYSSMEKLNGRVGSTSRLHEFSRNVKPQPSARCRRSRGRSWGLIHPFLDVNGRIARLLTVLLLYQHGYNVGRFVSLERVIEASRQTYYDALHRSSQGWHEGRHDPVPWWSYWLGTVVVAYREFEERAGILMRRRGAKTEFILDAIRRIPGEFTLRELQRNVPDVGIDLLRRVVSRERAAGRLERIGNGPNVRWRRVGDSG